MLRHRLCDRFRVHALFLADLFAAPGGVDDVRHLPGRWAVDALVGRSVWRAAGGAQPAGLRRRRVAADADDGGAAFYAAADQGAGAGCLRLGLGLERYVGRYRRRLRLSLGLERVFLLEPAADGDRRRVHRLRPAAGSAAAGAPAAVQLARPVARRHGARHVDGGHFTGGAPRLAELAADLRFIIGRRRIIGVISD